MVYSALTVTKNEDEASLMIHIQIALYTVGLISSFKKQRKHNVASSAPCLIGIRTHNFSGDRH
jgi:hypothetical protein